jgi:RNA-directed DNA polymerase
VAAVLSTMGLHLSVEKTMIAHIDQGFDFLGFRIQRQTKRGSKKAFVYTWPSKKALASIKAKVKAISKQGINSQLSDLLRRLNGCCEAGPTTSATACPKRPSPTCTSSPGCAASDGFAPSIAGPTGSSCDDATWPTGGGPNMKAWRCSTVEQSR